MNAVDDPLADEYEGAACSNAACDHGWVTIARDKEGNFLGNNPTDPAIADKVLHTEVYPCQACDRTRFLQAANGCFARNHRPCELCEDRRAAVGGKRHADR